MTPPYKKISEVDWESHFMKVNGKIKWIYTREKDASPITVMLVRLYKGVTLPDHVHPDQLGRGQWDSLQRGRRICHCSVESTHRLLYGSGMATAVCATRSKDCRCFGRP